jgi:hypothetical protein
MLFSRRAFAWLGVYTVHSESSKWFVPADGQAYMDAAIQLRTYGTAVNGTVSISWVTVRPNRIKQTGN